MISKPITTSNKLIHNALYNIVTPVVISIIGFFMIPFLVKSLGAEIYGIWILVGSIFRYRNMMSLGLNSAVNRYIPVYLAKGDDEGIQRVISTSSFLFFIVTLLLLAATVVLYIKVGVWFAIRPELIGVTQILILVVGVGFAVGVLFQAFQGVLSGFQRYDIINIAILLPIIIRTVLLVVFLSQGYGLITVGVLYVASEIAIRFLQFLYFLIMFRKIPISIRGIDFSLLREMLFYGVNTFLYAMGALIIYKSSDIIIGVFLTTSDITKYSVVTMIVMLLSQFGLMFTRGIKPAISELDARDDTAKIREIALLTQKYVLIVLIPSASFLIIMGRQFLEIWMGKDFGALSTILILLTIAQFLRLAQHSNFIVLVGKGEHKVFGILMALTALAVVILAVVSVKVFNLGLMGIALSNFIPMLLTFGLIIPFYSMYSLGISLKENLRFVWFPAFAGCFPAIIMIGIWKHLNPPADWFEIGMVVVLAGLLTVFCSWSFSLTKTEQKRFSKALIPSRFRS